MPNSMLAAVAEAAAGQPAATAPAAAPVVAAAAAAVSPPAPAPAPAAAAADAVVLQPDARAHAAGLAELYALAHPGAAAAFTALAGDIRAGKAEGEVRTALLAGGAKPALAAPVDNLKPDNALAKPGAAAAPVIDRNQVYGDRAKAMGRA